MIELLWNQPTYHQLPFFLGCEFISSKKPENTFDSADSYYILNLAVKYK